MSKIALKTTFKPLTSMQMIAMSGLILAGGIGAYYRFVLTEQIRLLKDLDQQIETKQRQLRIQEANYSNLETNRQKILELTRQLEIEERKIARYPEMTNNMIVFEQLLRLYDLQIIEFTLSEPQMKELGEGEGVKDYYETTIQLLLQGTYDQVKMLIEGLKQSQKLFYLRQLSISPLEQEDRADMVTASLDFSSYSLEGADPMGPGIYPFYHFMEFGQPKSNPFYYEKQSVQQETETWENLFPEKMVSTDPGTKTVVHVVEKGETLWGIAYQYGVTVQQLQELNHIQGHIIHTGQELLITGSEKTVGHTASSYFRVFVGSMYTSGDNYYIVGPYTGGKSPILQAHSQEPAKMRLRVYPEGYGYILETAAGEQSHEESIPVADPHIVIESDVRDIQQDVNIRLDLYIQNDTGQALLVELEEKRLERVRIFDAEGRQISPGDRSGSIVVQKKGS